MDSVAPLNVLWDLLLAGIPVFLGYGLAWSLGGPSRPRRLPLPLCWLLGLAWLAFLPNSCYLLTEWRHLLFDERWAHLRYSGNTDRQAMLRTAMWAAFFVMFSGVGVLCFTLAIRPVERWLWSTGRRSVRYAPFLFLLVSLGVYLGLIVRANTWDLLLRPMRVVEAALEAIAHPIILAAVGVFALFLWALYEAVDLWLDGLLERVASLGRISRPE